MHADIFLSSYHSVNGGLWGGQPRLLQSLLEVSIEHLMKGYKDQYVLDMYFLDNTVWPRVQSSTYCHDSVTCDRWANSHPFPSARIQYEHVGQVSNKISYKGCTQDQFYVHHILSRWAWNMWHYYSFWSISSISQ